MPCRSIYTNNDLTGTLLHQSKRALPYWILATFLLCLACSSRRIARELGVHIRTSYHWCWWLRNAALAYEMGRQLEGTVDADALYHTAGHKGQATPGGKKVLGRRARSRRKNREPGRGDDDKDRLAIIAWVSRRGGVVVQATRDFTVKTVHKAATIAVETGSRLYTDSVSSYRTLKGYAHDFVNHTKKEYARGDIPENLRCGKVDIGILLYLSTRLHRQHAILKPQGGARWIASSCGRAMVKQCVRPSSWATWSTWRRPAKS